MSTRVHESAVLHVSSSDVWKAIKALDFKFLPRVTGITLENNAGQYSIGGERTITYQEGKGNQTSQRVMLVAMDEIKRSISWDLVASTPAVTYSSASHTMIVHRVTANDVTYIEWVTDFSGDANQSVIQDMRFKQLDAFAALATHFQRRKGGRSGGAMRRGRRVRSKSPSIRKRSERGAESSKRG